MNIEKLGQLKSWLLAGAPERKFNMRFLLDELQLDLPPEERNWCGTSCCMAGYVATAMNAEADLLRDYQSIEGIAAEILGLSLNLANALFYPKVYPVEDLDTQNYWPAWEDITAEQAAQAVQNVIDHKNPHWEEILE